MPFRLIPPGSRNNKYWYARISVAGRRYEISTDEVDEKRAGRVAREKEARFRVAGAPVVHPTVSDALDAYISFRRPRKLDLIYLEAVRSELGKLEAITQRDVDLAAQRLYPDASPATWNRCVYTPLLAALAHSGIRPKINRPRQPKPVNRAISDKDRDKLLAKSSGDLRRLLLIIFYTGARVSEAVNLTWENVSLGKNRIRLDVSKTGEHGWRAMHPRLRRDLALTEDIDRRGKVLRWKTRWGPRKALAALVKETGLSFTPHQGRHTFATLLVDAGASLKDVMEAGGWASIQSVTRYVGSNTKRLRGVVGKI
jgi:integrase